VRPTSTLSNALHARSAAARLGLTSHDHLARRRNYGQWLADTLPTMIDSVQVAKGELCIVVTTPAIMHVMTFLRDHTNCQVRSRFLR
jgi:hypothetical protein